MRRRTKPDMPFTQRAKVFAPLSKRGIATRALVGLLWAQAASASLPSFSEAVATVPNPGRLQLSCGGEMPTLLGAETQTKENLQAYYSYYRRRQVRRAVDDLMYPRRPRLFVCYAVHERLSGIDCFVCRLPLGIIFSELCLSLYRSL